MKEVSDEVSKQLKAKDQTETAQYILSYGNFESVMERLGPQVEELLKTARFAFARKGGIHHRSLYVEKYHELFRQVTDSYLRSRDHVGPLLLTNLRKFATTEPKPETNFQLFARRCVQHVFEVCQNELKLFESFFINGPILANYSGVERWSSVANYADLLEQNRLSHLKTLFTFMTPYLTDEDLHRISELVNWLEITYPVFIESEHEREGQQNDRSTVLFLLREHLWPLCDSLFIKAARQLEYYKPSADDLKIGGPPPGEFKKSNASQNVDTDIKNGHDAQTPSLSDSTVYPTVKTATSLLLMYNESLFDRPVSYPLFYVSIG